MKQKHHIIPLHMGGPNTPANIKEITVMEHSLAHKKLYEEHGNWQDYVLWHGLAKLTDNLEAVTLFMEAGGRTGTKLAYIKDNKANNEELNRKIQDSIGKDWTGPNAIIPAFLPGWNGKSYSITHPSGYVEITEDLLQWCLDKNVNYDAFTKAAIKGTRTTGGYTISRA